MAAAASAGTAPLHTLLTPAQERECMELAIEEARKGLSEGGIPIGSVLVRVRRRNEPGGGGEFTVIGRGHNQRVQQGSPTLHAEIDCIERAGRQKRYDDCVLFSTLMPCFLCGGCVVQFGIRRVVAGEAQSFTPHSAEMMAREAGVTVVNQDRDDCKEMMADFVRRCPQLWNEDIGVPDE